MLCEVQRMEGSHKHDPATGRPVEHGHELVTELTDEELNEELEIAAMSPGRSRLERFKTLLAEQRRRWASRRPTA